MKEKTYKPDVLKQSFKDHFKKYLTEEELEKAFSLIETRVEIQFRKYTLPGAPRPTREELKRIVGEIMEDEILRDKALKYFKP